MEKASRLVVLQPDPAVDISCYHTDIALLCPRLEIEICLYQLWHTPVDKKATKDLAFLHPTTLPKQLYCEPEKIAGIIVLGGRMDAIDEENYPWIGEIIDFLRTRGQNIPVLGICIGHQILARTWGGKLSVARIRHSPNRLDSAPANNLEILEPTLAEKSAEEGPYQLIWDKQWITATFAHSKHHSSSAPTHSKPQSTLKNETNRKNAGSQVFKWLYLGEDPLTNETGTAQPTPFLNPVVYESHNDYVTSIPPEAHLVAGSETCSVQAFYRGLHLGVQFHPEVDAAQVIKWHTNSAETHENSSENNLENSDNFVQACLDAQTPARQFGTKILHAYLGMIVTLQQQ